jgi:hypothetical protein
MLQMASVCLIIYCFSSYSRTVSIKVIHMGRGLQMLVHPVCICTCEVYTCKLLIINLEIEDNVLFFYTIIQ